MKKILKNIGIISLAIAILLPFVKLPKVSAANNSDCDTYLQSYMFLDVLNNTALTDEHPNCDEKGGCIFGGYVGGHENYALYPYKFTEKANSTITINKNKFIF